MEVIATFRISIQDSDREGRTDPEITEISDMLDDEIDRAISVVSETYKIKFTTTHD